MRPRAGFPGRIWCPVLNRCVGVTKAARRKCKAAVGRYNKAKRRGGVYDPQSS